MKSEEIMRCWSEQKPKLPFGSSRTDSVFSVWAWSPTATSLPLLHTLSHLHSMPSSSWYVWHSLYRCKKYWNKEISVNIAHQCWSCEVNHTFGMELRLFWSKIYHIFGYLYLHFLFTSYFLHDICLPLWKEHIDNSCWMCMNQELWSMIYLLRDVFFHFPLFLNAENKPLELRNA